MVALKHRLFALLALALIFGAAGLDQCRHDQQDHHPLSNVRLLESRAPGLDCIDRCYNQGRHRAWRLASYTPNEWVCECALSSHPSPDEREELRLGLLPADLPNLRRVELLTGRAQPEACDEPGGTYRRHASHVDFVCSVPGPVTSFNFRFVYIVPPDPAPILSAAY